jgi:hypothetical protein
MRAVAAVEEAGVIRLQCERPMGQKMAVED